MDLASIDLASIDLASIDLASIDLPRDTQYSSCSLFEGMILHRETHERILRR